MKNYYDVTYEVRAVWYQGKRIESDTPEEALALARREGLSANQHDGRDFMVVDCDPINAEEIK